MTTRSPSPSPRRALCFVRSDGACNPLVAEQSVKEIVAQLPETSAKFLTSSRQAKFPCDSVDHNLFFMGSEYPLC